MNWVEGLLAPCFGLVTLCFPIVHKMACECNLGGDREEGHGGKAWVVMVSASLEREEGDPR